MTYDKGRCHVEGHYRSDLDVLGGILEEREDHGGWVRREGASLSVLSVQYLSIL